MTVRYAQASAVLSRHSFGSLVLLPVGGSEPVLLAGSGSLVWTLLSEPIAVDELCGVLSEATGESSVTVAGDVEPLLAALIEHGLVETMT